jgi:hypothetical protein
MQILKQAGCAVSNVWWRSVARLQAAWPLTEDFVYLCTFSNVSEASIGNHFYVAVFRPIFVNVLILVVAISRCTRTV